eukprot:6213827-Pleurochrysis_carterae.AAC.1
MGTPKEGAPAPAERHPSAKGSGGRRGGGPSAQKPDFVPPSMEGVIMRHQRAGDVNEQARSCSAGVTRCFDSVLVAARCAESHDRRLPAVVARRCGTGGRPRRAAVRPPLSEGRADGADPWRRADPDGEDARGRDSGQDRREGALTLIFLP